MSFESLSATEGRVQSVLSKHSTLNSFGWWKKVGPHRPLYIMSLLPESLWGIPDFTRNSTLSL